jgi:hypothetical protein
MDLWTKKESRSIAKIDFHKKAWRVLRSIKYSLGKRFFMNCKSVSSYSVQEVTAQLDLWLKTMTI